MIYVSPCAELVTHKRNGKKKNVSFAYNINKLCSWFIHRFVLWWVKCNFRDETVFRLVSTFSSVQKSNQLYTLPLDVSIYTE